jgi:hypothetical protein
MSADAKSFGSAFSEPFDVNGKTGGAVSQRVQIKVKIFWFLVDI